MCLETLNSNTLLNLLSKPISTNLACNLAEPNSTSAKFHREPKPISKRQAYYPSPLPNEGDERTALQVYQTIEACSGKKILSSSNARCLVAPYGADNVKAALARLMVMHRKGKIASAAGFFVVAARLDWRQYAWAARRPSAVFEQLWVVLLVCASSTVCNHKQHNSNG
jgi:hypothetical protein